MKKIFNSRALALILVLAMAVSLFTFSASAATTESLSGHGSNISTITATGVNYETVEYATSTDPHGTIYDYYLAVPAETANGTELTVAFTPAANVSSNFVISKFGANVPNPPQGINYIYSGASNTYTATMTDGAALVTAYVHNDVRGASAHLTPMRSISTPRNPSAFPPAILCSSHGMAILALWLAAMVPTRFPVNLRFGSIHRHLLL